ncbi:hypothetical protein D0817_20930 [Flavobacterium cupreum]|uniref:Uncharacterized protein n=1 Tax=Flavobacterium cupreum TaxID=2133766 RepID=A0A434A1Y3_9FLAO|nr:hypothetical protein D0817_20930 [Flavobacterium cupreum]
MKASNLNVSFQQTTQKQKDFHFHLAQALVFKKDIREKKKLCASAPLREPIPSGARRAGFKRNSV